LSPVPRTMNFIIDRFSIGLGADLRRPGALDVWHCRACCFIFIVYLPLEFSPVLSLSVSFHPLIFNSFDLDFFVLISAFFITRVFAGLIVSSQFL